MTVDMREIARYMRMGKNLPEGELAERVEALRAEAMRVIRPAGTWRRFPVEGGAVEAGALRMEVSGSLARHLDGCRAVYLACGTIGAGFDALQRRVSITSGVDALIAQAVGAALIERHMHSLEEEIIRELAPGESLIPRYSPGYGDFPLAAQRTLLALLDAQRRVGVSLTETLLMVPSKSVSAVIGVRRG